jgi:hypothetical protein
LSENNSSFSGICNKSNLLFKVITKDFFNNQINNKNAQIDISYENNMEL